MRVAMNVIAILAFSGAHASAATTGLDTRFGTGGIALLGPTPVSGQKMGVISAIATQTDGKLLIAGRITDPSGPGMGSFLPAVGRLNVDGSWDATFANHGLFVLPYATASAPYGGGLQTVGLMSDGEILASGGTYSAHFAFNALNSCTLLLKLTSAGVLDANFSAGNGGSFCYDFAGTASTWILHFDGIAIDSDDTWYLTSPYTNFNYGAVAHFDATGALVTSYGSGGVAALPSGVFTTLLEIQPDHALLVGGAHIASGTQSIAVVRLNTLGATDSLYGNAGEFTIDPQSPGVVSPTGIALDAQGRLLISDDDSSGPYRFARATLSGTPDSTFNGNAQQPGYAGFAIPTVSGNANIDLLVAAQPLADGHIFAIGNAGQVAASDGATNIALLRLNDDSSYDTSFGDATHPGWASLHIGAAGTSNAYARALVFDDTGHAFIAINAADINNNGCSGIIRAIPDQLFSDSFDPESPVPTCPQ